MRTSITALLNVLLVSTTTVLAQQNVTSAPFALVLQSMNTTLNNTVLTGCHEGAAIEGLCASYSPLSFYTSNSSLKAPTYTFNTSSISTTDPQPGVLIFELGGYNFNYSLPLSFSYNPTSNVAIPLFTPADGDQFVFSDTNLLGVQGFVNDTQTPIKFGPQFVVRRWYVCETYYGYRYTTLAWALGTGEPENPSCVKVEVMRVFC